MTASLLSHFALSNPPKTEIAPSAVFHIGPVAITNTVLFGWVTAILMIIFFVWVARRMTIRPKGGVFQFVEIVAEFAENMVKDAFEDRERAHKYVPFFVTVFFFVLINNLSGLIPGIGEPVTLHGANLLRSATSDFNLTIAMAAIMMVLVYVSSVREVGLKAYFGHFFMGSIKNPLYIFIAAIEMITDFTRVISLSLRLFLNVAVAELIIVVFAWLGSYLAPVAAVPFYFLAVFDGLLQAYIFALLGVMYLAIAVNEASHKDHEEPGDAKAASAA